jgi:hypothetical protein
VSDNLPWWEKEGSALARDVCAAAADLRNRQTHRWAAMELAFCLYDDASGSDLTVSDFTFEILDSELRTPLNLVRSCCDTVRAEMIQSRLRVQCSPTGADWGVRQRCRKMTRFLQAIFAKEAVDRVTSAVVLDALVHGTGIARPVVEDGKIRIERIPPWELWCDADEARYGEPRTLYLTRYAHRDVLRARYPEAADTVDLARTYLGRRRGQIGAEMVAIVEAWHLPSSPDAGDGLHVIAVDADGDPLFVEAWPHDWFPFAFLRWKAPQQGFWGQGLAGELVEVQAELNKATYNVQVGQELHAHTHILASKGSGLNPEQMTDEPGKIWWYNGVQAPQALTFPAVSPEVYVWIKDLIAWGYQFSGVSSAAARSERPAGLATGRAIQLNADLQTRRFIDPQRDMEQFTLDLSERTVDVVTHGAKHGHGSLKVTYQAKHRGEELKWSDVALDRESFRMRIDPVSATPQTPAGRSDYIQGLIASGQAAQVGAPEWALRELQDLGAEAFQQTITVAWDLVDQILEDILEQGEDGYRPPESFFNLSVCLLVGVTNYQLWTLWGVPEDRRDVLRDWLDAVRTELDRLAPPPPAGPPGPAPDAAAPPAPPMAA